MISSLINVCLYAFGRQFFFNYNLRHLKRGIYKLGISETQSWVLNPATDIMKRKAGGPVYYDVALR